MVCVDMCVCMCDGNTYTHLHTYFFCFCVVCCCEPHAVHWSDWETHSAVTLCGHHAVVLTPTRPPTPTTRQARWKTWALGSTDAEW